MKTTRLPVLFTALVCAACMAGCAPGADADAGSLSFRLDITGSYKGFESLPANYTAGEAVRDGCYVRSEGSDFGGADAWENFVSDSESGIDCGVRIVQFWNGDFSATDVFFHSRSYRCFTNGNDLKDRKFKMLRVLEGTLPNAAKSGRVTVLTDDPSLTYYQVMMTFLSSDSHYRDTVPPFRQILLD